MENAAQTLHRLTSYEHGREWNEPTDDPRIVQDIVSNDVATLPWFYKRYPADLPRVPLPKDLPPSTVPAVSVLAGWFAFGETLGLLDGLGMALVAAALVIVRAGEKVG